MKKYFVTADIHGFYSILMEELAKQGFDIKNKDHYLILCGDAFDRGKEAKLLLDFLLKLDKQNRLIYIKGNHEYLLEYCLRDLKTFNFNNYFPRAHIHNGTVDTISQLTGINEFELLAAYDDKKVRKLLKDYFKLTSKCFNYFELNDYIFVHGWIPHVRTYSELKKCDTKAWEAASWLNGMQEWFYDWRLRRKTIVCGHWHCSWGNWKYHKKGKGDFEDDSCFDPFIDKGIIALDACTATTKRINVIVLDEI